MHIRQRPMKLRTRGFAWKKPGRNWPKPRPRLRNIKLNERSRTVASEAQVVDGHVVPVHAAGGHGTDGHGHDGHVPGLHHHFDDMEQQRECTSLGMWSFLATEVMMFGGLFFAYCLYRWQFHDAYLLGSQQLNITWGTINTFV